MTESERAWTGQWVGPFRLREYLERSIDPDQVWPPASGGVYVLSRLAWTGTPTPAADALYVGGNTGVSPRFITRIGDLVADVLGFWCNETAHSSGGWRVWEYCFKERIHPLDLYLGWIIGVPCARCAETDVYDALQPRINLKRPAGCADHCVPS